MTKLQVLNEINAHIQGMQRIKVSDSRNQFSYNEDAHLKNIMQKSETLTDELLKTATDGEEKTEITNAIGAAF